jgi:hypothetical protein
LQYELSQAVKLSVNKSFHVEEKHIFKSQKGDEKFKMSTELVECRLPPSNLDNSRIPESKVISLSKIIEFPGDFTAIKQILEKNNDIDSDLIIDPGGIDMFGLTAFHKFASWNKVDLLELLLPYLKDSDINMSGITYTS